MSSPRRPSGALPRISEASLYSHLVTRPTGRAVREEIERELRDWEGPAVTVVDLRNVPVIDFSCADEVVAKLVCAGLAGGGARRSERFYLFTGLEEHHLDPVESSLHRRSLAAAAERVDGTPCLLGRVEPGSRRVWAHVVRAGRVRPESLVPDELTSVEQARHALEELHARRLLVRLAGEYLSLRAAADATPDGGAR